METRKLEFACPVCASKDVVYTCTPDCCFNHLCGSCGSTFEPVTAPTGKVRTGLAGPNPSPEASDPTVACARCHATTVFLTGDSELVCVQCGSLLTLEFTELARNTD